MKRKFFAELNGSDLTPNLIEIQKNSYNWFLEEGLLDLFDEISPVTDFIGRDLKLYFEDYYLDEPKFNEAQSKAKNITYEAPLRIRAKLVNNRTGETVKQEVFLRRPSAYDQKRNIYHKRH